MRTELQVRVKVSFDSSGAVQSCPGCQQNAVLETVNIVVLAKMPQPHYVPIWTAYFQRGDVQHLRHNPGLCRAAQDQIATRNSTTCPTSVSTLYTFEWSGESHC